MVDVQGVGYELEAPMSTFYALPAPGDKLCLFTHLAIREDAHVLYGFSSESERALFRSLLRISGVGAKMALAILSGMTAEDFARCVQSNDTAALVRLPGIGKKTAERLIIEMRDRIERLQLPMAADISGIPPSSASPAENPLNDALDALVALGYRPADAGKMVRGVPTEGLSSEEIIRVALKSMAERVK